MKRRAFDCSMDQKREYHKNLIGCAVERKYPRWIMRMKCINVLESLKVTLNANLREVAIVSPNWSIASFTFNTHFQTMSDWLVFQHVRKCMWWLFVTSLLLVRIRFAWVHTNKLFSNWPRKKKQRAWKWSSVGQRNLCVEVSQKQVRYTCLHELSTNTEENKTKEQTG